MDRKLLSNTMDLCSRPLTLLLPSLWLPEPPLAVQVGDDLGRQLDVVPDHPLVRRQAGHCPDSPGGPQLYWQAGRTSKSNLP